MQSTIQLYKPKLKQALVLSLPIIAGQLGQVLMGLFDTIQIGVLGTEYIAAAGFSNTVYWMICLLGLGIMSAISPLVSEAFGEKNGWKSIGVFRSGLKACAVIAVLFTVIIYIVVLNIDKFQQAPEINKLATDYLLILNVSTFALMFYGLGKGLTDGMGKTTIGMALSIGGLLLNVFLNWVLITGHLGAPALGIKGTAIATATSRILMTVAIFIYIWKSKKMEALREEYRQKAEAGKSYIKHILTIGIPSSLQFFFEVAAFSISQIMTGWLGVVYLASHQIAISLASTTFMILMGFATAGTIMTGYSYGAKDKEGARLAGNAIFILTAALEIVFAVIFFVGYKFLPSLYTDDKVLIGTASGLVILAAFFQISDGLQAAAAGALRGLQDVKASSIIALFCYWGVMVPLCYFLAFHTSLGIKGIWVGFIVGLTIAAVVLILRFRWKVNNIEFEEL
jgi:MATE family multidrug resistance protein